MSKSAFDKATSRADSVGTLKLGAILGSTVRNFDKALDFFAELGEGKVNLALRTAVEAIRKVVQKFDTVMTKPYALNQHEQAAVDGDTKANPKAKSKLRQAFADGGAGIKAGYAKTRHATPKATAPNAKPAMA